MNSRWDYLREVMMPCVPELYTMEQIGLRADWCGEPLWVGAARGVCGRERVCPLHKHHNELVGQEAKIKADLAACAPVAEALRRRVVDAERTLESATLAREIDVALKKKAREGLEKGKKKGVSLASEYTKVVAKARGKVESAQEFNPGSAQQKAWLLYDEFRLPPQKHRKTKATTTDKNAMTRLLRLKWDRDRKPVTEEVRGVVKGLQEYEHVNQLRTTFVEVDVRDGRIYTLYGLHRTGTGRIASGRDDDEKAGGADTNFQNWPVELRDIIIPEDGCVFVSGDYSQVEWLLTLWFAKDMDGFKRCVGGEDSHRRVASFLYNVPYDEIEKEDPRRVVAKKANHADNYGQGEQNMADDAGISLEEAKRAKVAIKAAYPIVATYREDVVGLASRQKYLQTPFGWRRWFLEPKPDVPKILAFLPSATGADMLKVRLPRVAELARKWGGRLMTTTHDSFLLEVPEGVGKEVASELKVLMELPFRMLDGLSFPTEVKIGWNWKEVS